MELQDFTFEWQEISASPNPKWKADPRYTVTFRNFNHAVIVSGVKLLVFTTVKTNRHKQVQEERKSTKTNSFLSVDVIKPRKWAELDTRAHIYWLLWMWQYLHSWESECFTQFIMIAGLFVSFSKAWPLSVSSATWFESRVVLNPEQLVSTLDSQERRCESFCFFFLWWDSHYDQCEMCLYFHWQRNNDWAKLNRDPDSDKQPQSVINGSILPLWESSQLMHEWREKKKRKRRTSKFAIILHGMQPKPAGINRCFGTIFVLIHLPERERECKNAQMFENGSEMTRTEQELKREGKITARLGKEMQFTTAGTIIS